MAGKSTISITFKLDGDGKGFKDLSQNADGLKQAMTAAIVEADKLKSSLINWSQGVQALGAVSNAVSQLNGTLQDITADSRAFGAAMKAANTMAGKNAEGFANLKGQVADLSKTLPIARDELANGLYQVISNGVPEDNWIDYLNKSAKASVGGIADLGETVKVTSTVIKNYGLAWDAAESVQDKIQLTAKNGVTSFEQLAQALPRVTANASTLGVSVDELLASFATLTGVSGNTNEVATQMAAIFTALVKPSSEATEMAEKMGIEFNAASIQAAGGLRNFLTQLDASVKEYAAANGVLEQEVYAKLFGSAESLRALTPLTNQLSEKFCENVDAMANSAGTINAAYNEMSSTGSATTQMLKNQLGAITDVVAGFVGSAMPFVSFIANTGVMVMSITSLVKTFKALNIQQAILTLRSKAGGAAMLLFGLNASRSAAFTRVFSAALKSGAYSATAFKIALKGLMITTVVGAAIVAVTSVIEYFVNKTDEATDKTNEFSEAEDAYKSAAASTKVELDKEIKALGDLITAKKDTTDAVNHLNAVYGDLFGSHKTASEWYDTLTRKSQIYVKQIGYEAQAKVLATKLAEKQIELEDNYAKRRALWKAGGAQKTTKRTITNRSTGGDSYEVVTTEDTKEYADLKDSARGLIPEIQSLQRQLGIAQKHMADCSKQMAAVDAKMRHNNKTVKVSAMTYQQVADAIEKTEKRLKNTTNSKEIAKLKAYNAELHNRKKLLDKSLGFNTFRGSRRGNKVGSVKNKPVADPKTYEQLSTNIEYYKKKLTTASTAEQEKIRANIQAWEKKKAAIELAQKAAERPTEIKTLQDVEKELDYLQTLRKTANKDDLAGIDKLIGKTELLGAAMQRPAKLETLQDIDKEIEYQQKLRATASKEAISGIDAEISKLETLKNYIENATVIDTPDSALKTYEQLNIKLAYYNELLEKATEEQRPEIQKHINDIEGIKKAWDDSLAALNKPADISQLDTIEKLDEAVRYYQERQSKQSADEIQNTQRTIDALEAKRKAIQRGIEIPSMQKEIAEINGLSNREFKIKVKGIGFDALTDKIRELQKQLNDTNNPVTEGQRKDIEEMISTYEQWRKSSISSFDTVKSGWDDIKGIGDSINSITDALDGNGNAWQKVTAFVDGFIQLYESISTIVGIIDMLTVASTAHAAAKTGEAAATTATATAQGVETAAQTAAAAAMVPVIAANKLATASYMELAAAMFFAAHASIPFVGFGIASGFVSAATAMVEAIGVMPFAKGGVVSGPTLALVGEYAGASNNPEVIAPLDKLRSMIQPQGGIGGNVRFEIEGRKLVGVISNTTRVAAKSGRKSNF
ncbi:phage tail tape measure protein [Phascolarctobacterium succinatutens]|uniref:phage tail tape measure protein n=1 Tax=Phascolarctobacterium succinatutens TaxID=626940 RepID=UPI002E776408|nr:phage tail tape measure protein [Phascolarctobacterium succinatutens]MEE0509498.1 phage tail tape measure protein [Phascolarctobacterium succinatutens]